MYVLRWFGSIYSRFTPVIDWRPARASRLGGFGANDYLPYGIASRSAFRIETAGFSVGPDPVSGSFEVRS